MSPGELTPNEREQLISAVDTWQDLGSEWYVDTYLVPVVQQILLNRAISDSVRAE